MFTQRSLIYPHSAEREWATVSVRSKVRSEKVGKIWNALEGLRCCQESKTPPAAGCGNVDQLIRPKKVRGTQ